MSGLRFAVVTASSSGYYSLLQGLLASLEKAGRIPIHVLDIGLDKQQIEELHDRGIETTIPGWDIEIKDKTVRSRHGKKVPLPDHFRSFTAQPFLPKHVTGYDILVWIDADCWLQDGKALDLLVSTAAEGKLAVVLEVDRSYGAPYWRLKSHALESIRAFGPSQGFALVRKMTANAGVLALKADAPHWGLWQQACRFAMRRPHQRSQQMALNYVVHIDKAPTAFLPALYNWQTWEATPLFDERTGLLVEPNPPYHPLAIIHNAQANKDLIFTVETRGGKTIQGTMRYEQWNQREPLRRIQ